MGYKIGIDFGTTNSTVSYFDDQGRLTAFKYPGPEGHEYIPSCIAYLDEEDLCVGRAALDYAGDDSSDFCSTLKMVLPLPEPEREKYAWSEKRVPETAIKDFFGHVLVKKNGDEDDSSFGSQIGRIEGVVFSVPAEEIWGRPAYSLIET